jgi:hypothetical protein
MAITSEQIIQSGLTDLASGVFNSRRGLRAANHNRQWWGLLSIVVGLGGILSAILLMILEGLAMLLEDIPPLLWKMATRHRTISLEKGQEHGEET